MIFFYLENVIPTDFFWKKLKFRREHPNRHQGFTGDTCLKYETIIFDVSLNVERSDIPLEYLWNNTILGFIFNFTLDSVFIFTPCQIISQPAAFVRICIQRTMANRCQISFNLQRKNWLFVGSFFLTNNHVFPVNDGGLVRK